MNDKVKTRKRQDKIKTFQKADGDLNTLKVMLGIAPEKREA